MRTIQRIERTLATTAVRSAVWFDWVTVMLTVAATMVGAGIGVAAAAPKGSTETMLVDLGHAVVAVGQFWDAHFTELFGLPYTAPEVVGLYSEDTDNALVCAGQAQPADNALYCPQGHYVAWGDELIAQGTEIGDAWAYFVVAHEWGHAVAAQLPASLVTDDQELQADCLAGAAIYGAVAEGTLILEPGDEQELVEALAALADQTPWTTSTDHGDAFERVDAFNRGRTGGVDACLG
ncbi:neutral zinc metallopeptidase [Rhodococcus aetherivorans]|uniref:neutral zinc metallopeptidase n=1 Tax=Rhodococcus aetherivorans TaxID=191292 RepID=UPI00366AB5CC